ELHHLTAGDVLEEFFLGVLVASVFGGDVSQCRAILFFLDRVALVAAAVTGQAFGSARVHGCRIQARQKGGRRSDCAKHQSTSCAEPLGEKCLLRQHGMEMTHLKKIDDLSSLYMVGNFLQANVKHAKSALKINIFLF